MKGYTTRQVAEVLGLPTSRILAWTRRGLLSPRRGPRNAYVYSFQDIALLRATRGLLDADVSVRKVGATLEALREQLPVGRPLSAVSIAAVGDRVLVRDEDTVWEPDSGQLRIDFSATDADEAVPVARRALGEARSEASTADEWYGVALDLEANSLDAAAAAYREALALNPSHADAHLNLGRILHEMGRTDEAEEEYRKAIEADPTSARALYNLGVAREDRDAPEEARAAYEKALRLDPGLAVAHFNLSRLLEAEGREAEALAHLMRYKEILEEGEPGR
ncbi:MAG: tetratricopeptide repeat protein [Longimicrobiales bacterium]|nr:tetratricopeptide repeat protein [Longimicrobiales bacterium]